MEKNTFTTGYGKNILILIVEMKVLPETQVRLVFLKKFNK